MLLHNTHERRKTEITGTVTDNIYYYSGSASEM